MTSRSLKYYLAGAIIVLIIPFLKGCAIPGGYFAASVASFIAIHQYESLPDGTTAEVANPGKGAKSAAVVKAPSMSILTNNQHVEEHMAGKFRKITFTKDPLSIASAAATAKKGGHDAFFIVYVSGPSVKVGIAADTVVYSTVRVRLVASDGSILYEQTASLMGNASSRQTPDDHEIAAALASVIVTDFEQSIAAVSGAPAPVAAGPAQEDSPSLWGKVKGKAKSIFN
jgi:hypothetical protein